ncbi:MAG: hypothetical protein E7157_04620 [Lactobacillales bacterium]|nr:hypothetical protein [Lactobacillales bacterium]
MYCGECGKEMTDNKCVNCDNKNKKGKNNKKYIFIFVILIVLITVGIFVFKFLEEQEFQKNKNNFPKTEVIGNDIEKSVNEEIGKMTINGEKFSHKFNSKNIKYIKYKESTDTSLKIMLHYKVEDIVSFEIPFQVYYSFDGKEYKFKSLFNLTEEGEKYKNIKITSCEKIKNKDGKTTDDIINEKYKEKYDSIKLRNTKAEGNNVCISTYEATSDKKYIDKNSKITITNTLFDSSVSKEFTITSSDVEELKVSFDLVGKYKGDHVTRGFFHDKSWAQFEITKVDGNSVNFGSSGKIVEGNMNYTLVAKDGYIGSTDYDYYTLDVGYKYGTDASGVDRDLTVRIYEDKLLYYCAYSDERTDECYTMNKN